MSICAEATVPERLPVDQAHRDRRKVVRKDAVFVILALNDIERRRCPAFFSLFGGWAEVNRKTNTLSDQAADGQAQSDVGCGDGCAACATVGVQHVAINVEGDRTECFKVNGGP